MLTSCHVTTAFFPSSRLLVAKNMNNVFFFLFFLRPLRFFSLLVMSNTPISQQQLPLEFPVPVHPGYQILPPISPSNHSVEQQSSSSNANNVDAESEKISIDVKDFWIKLREHINGERLKSYDKHGNQRTSNKVVRIFVSSTFTDFFNEREVLIKKVFTALRDEMGSFGIQIIDCDLRWGVNLIKLFQT